MTIVAVCCGDATLGPGRLEAATRAHSLHVVLMLRRRAIAPELGEPLHLIRRQYFVFR